MRHPRKAHSYDLVIDKFYAKARFYDAENRKFIAKDIGRDGLNWYAYCGDNPLVYYDPEGQYAIPTIVKHTLLNGTTIYICDDDVRLLSAYEKLINSQLNYKKNPDYYHKKANEARDVIAPIILGGDSVYMNYVYKITNPEAYKSGNNINDSYVAYYRAAEALKTSNQGVETGKALLDDFTDLLKTGSSYSIGSSGQIPGLDLASGLAQIFSAPQNNCITPQGNTIYVAPDGTAMTAAQYNDYLSSGLPLDIYLGMHSDVGNPLTQGAGKWTNPDGSIKWPPNNGFDGMPSNKTLQPGTRIDRYGGETGKFVSPEGTPYANRALPAGSETRPYSVYEVVKPIDVQSGKIAPWFDQPGGGVQYQFSQTIEELISSGFLRRLQ